MPRLRIDDHDLDVPDGTTVLDAARQVGIAIPTLCHAEGYRPSTSCFACVVRVEGRPGLVPACATQVTDGMVVASEAEDVQARRRMSVELLLSDHTGDCEAPCTQTCPAGLEIASMLRHIRADRLDRAAQIARRQLVLPASLGRVCPRFCERACRRGDLDEPVTIRALHRYAADGAVPTVPDETDKRVAVVGAGPAGLSAAFHLRRRGHACTIFDERAEPGGMFRYGVPASRLPREVLATEVDVIRRMGVDFRMTWRLGRDGTLDGLRSDHDAVFLALGAAKDEMPDADGEATGALEFLASGGCKPAVDPRQPGPYAPGSPGPVLVVGGDEIATDVAQTAVELGAAPVTCYWPQDAKRASAWVRERLAEAEAAGVRVTYGQEPPEPAGATVVRAAGRRVDGALLDELGLVTTKRGVKVDRHTLATSVADVFAGGDVVGGPGHGVQAVAAGRRAADSIDAYLSGSSPPEGSRPFNSRLGTLSDTQRAAFFNDADPAARATPMSLDADEARTQAARCAQCDCRKKDTCRLRELATDLGAKATRYRGERRPFSRETTHPDIVFEPGKCIQCGLCIQAAEGADEALGLAMVRRGFVAQPAVPFDETMAAGLRDAARRCAEVCPTGAIALAASPDD